jgi:hypothetical protein
VTHDLVDQDGVDRVAAPFYALRYPATTASVKDGASASLTSTQRCGTGGRLTRRAQKRHRVRSARQPAMRATRTLDVLDRVALGALTLGSVALIGVFLVVSSSRITFPFELEWFEGLTIDTAYRIAHALPIYGPADETYAPGFYPPLHYLVTLPFLWATGWSLFGARLVSWLAIVGCGVVTALVLRRSGGSWVAVVFALGAAAAFYPATGFWYDLARVDSLATFFAVAGVALLESRRASRLWSGAVLLVCGVLTKQTVAPIALASVVFRLRTRMAERRRPRRRARSGGRRRRGNPLALDRRRHRARLLGSAQDLRDFGLLSMFGGFALGLLPYVLVAVAGAARRPAPRFFLCNALAALAMAILALSKIGGQENSAMPAIFLLAITAGLAADGPWRARRPSRDVASASSRRSRSLWRHGRGGCARRRRAWIPPPAIVPTLRPSGPTCARRAATSSPTITASRRRYCAARRIRSPTVCSTLPAASMPRRSGSPISPATRRASWPRSASGASRRSTRTARASERSDPAPDPQVLRRRARLR